MKSSSLIAGSIVLGSVIFSIPHYFDLLQSRNVISLSNGKVRLGEVYREYVEVSYTFKNDSGEVLLEGQAPISNLVESAKSDLESFVYNQNIFKNDKEKLTTETISITSPYTVTFNTSVTYTTEYHPSFLLGLDDTVVSYPAETSMIQAIESFNHYISTATDAYELATFITTPND